MEAIKINGTSLAYTIEGEGEPIVLVHSNLNDIRTWDALKPLLVNSGKKVITYARRFHWPNEAISDNQDDPWSQQVDDLAKIIEVLADGKAHVVGNSSAAFCGLLLVKNYPNLVKSLIIEEPPVISLFFPSLPPKLPALIKNLFTRPFSTVSILKFGIKYLDPALSSFKKDKDKVGMQYFAKGVFGRAFSKLTDEQLVRMELNLKPHKAALLGSGLPVFTPENAKNIKCPTLILTSEMAADFHVNINNRLKTLIPNSVLRIIPQAGHFMHEDNPKETARQILEFIGR
jgi:pimeloyl-ACP methyl ester carboxylesterase